MAIKYLSAEKKAKQKRNRIIITVVTTVLIITAIVLYLIFNTDLLKEVLTTGSFWTYPAIGIAVMLVVGFQNRKSDFSDKEDE